MINRSRRWQRSHTALPSRGVTDCLQISGCLTGGGRTSDTQRVAAAARQTGSPAADLEYEQELSRRRTRQWRSTDVRWPFRCHVSRLHVGGAQFVAPCLRRPGTPRRGPDGGCRGAERGIDRGRAGWVQGSPAPRPVPAYFA